VVVGVRAGDLVGRAEGVGIGLAVEAPLGEPVSEAETAPLLVAVALLESAPLGEELAVPLAALQCGPQS